MAINNTIFEALLNRGKITSGAEIVGLSKEYKEKFKIKTPNDLLKYLARHKYIRRIFEGFYYINSFDERTRNFFELEDKEILFRVLNKLKIKVMAWLAVDKSTLENKSGNEFIYEDRPIRFESWFNTNLVEDPSILLPKGSIEKLIGRKLTWKDDPVEI